MEEPQHIVHEEYSQYKKRTNKNYNGTFLVFGIGIIIVGFVLMFMDGPSPHRVEFGIYTIIAGVVVTAIGYFALKFSK